MFFAEQTKSYDLVAYSRSLHCGQLSAVIRGVVWSEATPERSKDYVGLNREGVCVCVFIV